MANCNSRCNFYFKVQGAPELRRCRPEKHQNFTPARWLIGSLAAHPGPVLLAGADGGTDGHAGGGRTHNDHGLSLRGLVTRSPARPGPGAPVRRNSQMQHRAPAYRCPHCFRPSHPPRRRDSRLPSMRPGQGHHARCRYRRSCQAAVLRRAIVQPFMHGICGWPPASDQMMVPGHYAACVTRRLDATAVHLAIGKNIARSRQIAHVGRGSAVVYRSGQKRY
jgi:hypothetical protein